MALKQNKDILTLDQEANLMVKYFIIVLMFIKAIEMWPAEWKCSLHKHVLEIFAIVKIHVLQIVYTHITILLYNFCEFRNAN